MARGKLRLTRDNDAWYEGEPSTREQLVTEVQRVHRRVRVHPFRWLLLAIAITSLISWKLITREHPVEAQVVLLLTEGSLADKHNGVPVDSLKDFVSTDLLPNDRLAKLIEDHHLFRIRSSFSSEDAIKELRENIELEIWKNTFINYEEEEGTEAEHSARIGITYTDTDPDRAMVIARELGQIVISEAYELRRKQNRALARSMAIVRDGLDARMKALAIERAHKDQQRQIAEHDHKPALAQALDLAVVSLDKEMAGVQKELYDIAWSRDIIADRIADKGLDMSLTVVEERPPDRPETQVFTLFVIITIVAFGALLGSALVVGAFDSRVHDTDDIERLGLPVLGHLPGFPGDRVGALCVRGASRSHGPMFRRWLSFK